MRLDAVMDEVAKAMSQVAGFNVFSYPPATASVPAGFVGYPQSIDFDTTYQRGEDTFTDLPVILLAGEPTEKSSRDIVTGWAAGNGPKSIKAALESWPWTTCDQLIVTSCQFAVIDIAGIEYLAVEFDATVVGPGED